MSRTHLAIAFGLIAAHAPPANSQPAIIFRSEDCLAPRTLTAALVRLQGGCCKELELTDASGPTATISVAAALVEADCPPAPNNNVVPMQTQQRRRAR
jgi:hypothetical protein